MSVFHEIAIDPSVIDSWTKLQIIDQAFGFNQGKLIAKYPFKGPNKKEKDKNWGWEVLQSIRAHDFKNYKQAEIFLLHKYFRKKLLNQNRTFNFDEAWIENARAEHKAKPFSGILCNVPNKDELEYDLNELHSLAEDCPEFWKDNHSFSLPKRASTVSRAFAPLLRASNHIIFVDPYFDPSHRRWQNPLREFIRATTKNNGRKPKFELHFSFQGVDRPSSAEELVTECERQFAYDLPKSISMKFAVWDRIPEEQRFHARFILTDLAGVAAEHGLDEVRTNEEFEFYLMAERHCNKASARFRDGGDGTYDLLSERIIEGQRETH